MDFEQAKTILSAARRIECRDHAFGDREIFWENAQGVTVAEGYVGSGGADVYMEADGTSFGGAEAAELVKLGTKGRVERNDSTGPDTYRDGQVMPGLTREGVLDELTRGGSGSD